MTVQGVTRAGMDVRTRIEEQVVRWHYGTLPAWAHLLQPLEWGWSAVVAARLAAYRRGWLARETVGVPVISVGNLTTGGTGKTPLVLAISEHLQSRGLRVVILSRGHRARTPARYARATDPCLGDEAYFLQERLPEAVVIVGTNRLENARRAMREYAPDVIVHDDGFQYLALVATLNILLVDGERLFGNGHEAPLGPLREPVAQLRRADQVWVTKTTDAAAMPRVSAIVKRFAGRPMPVHLVPNRVIGLRHLLHPAGDPPDGLLPHHQGRPCLLLSAISRPETFEGNLRDLGIAIAEHIRYPGHFWYTRREVEAVLAARPTPDTPVITTERDLVKVRELLPDSVRPFVYVLSIRPDLSAVTDVVDRAAATRTSSRSSGVSTPTPS